MTNPENHASSPWTMGQPNYAISKRISGTNYQDVLEQVTAALKKQGFGVLTEIDVKKTMQEKLNASLSEYKILGACNPPLALKALTEEPGVGALLPCNVVVAQEKDAVYVGAIDPVSMFQVIGRPEIEALAQEVKSRLESALAELP